MVERILSPDELEVLEEVGRGGFGVVYRGVVKNTRQEVAIKQIDLENDQADIFEINKFKSYRNADFLKLRNTTAALSKATNYGSLWNM